LDMVIENLERHSRLFRGGSRTIELRSGSDKHAELMWKDAGLYLFANPAAYRLDLLAFVFERANCRWWPVEYGNRVVPVFAVSIHVRYDRGEETVRLRADLVGDAVVNAQGARASPDVYTDGFPRERLLEDTLTQIASEEEGVWPISTQSGQEPEVGRADILRLIDDRVVEQHIPVLRDPGCE